MKSYATICSLLLVFALMGCATTNSSSSREEDENNIVLVKDLPNYINTLPRISVQGSQVYNTSASSISGTTSPLFVLDGIQIGRSLYDVMSLLNENQAVKVEFLKISRATIRYGEEGRNGVILINREQDG